MVNFSALSPAALVHTLVALFLLTLRLPVAAQAPAWQSAQVVPVVASSLAGSTPSPVSATAIDAAGNLYLTGNFVNTITLGTTTLTSLGGNDVFVAKFNPASNQFLWAQRAGGQVDDYATAVAVNGTSVYVAGYFISPTAGFGTTTLTNAGYGDAFVAKLTDAGSTGSFAWAQRAGGIGHDAVGALAVNGTSVYVAGAFGNSAGFGAVTLATAGTYDIFVAKLTDAGSTGGFVWAQRSGGSDDDYATALAVNGTSVYVAGAFISPTAGFGSTTLVNAGAYDVFVTKLTDTGSTGSFAWAQRAGGGAPTRPQRSL